MTAWNAPELVPLPDRRDPALPALPGPLPPPPPGNRPGRGPLVHLHDTATNKLLPSATGDVARLYVCGITPYDATHLGHAATYIAFDLLNRAWRDAGLDVIYVQNVTDVDDPLLERAQATGQDWQDLAREQTALFAQDMQALRVLPPQEYRSATQAVPLVVQAATRLLEQGHAYRVPGTNGGPDGDVYFSVHADPGFGRIGNLSPEHMLELFAERGGDPDRPGKRHPLDCLLWRVQRPGEPSWDGGTLGRGRPGWHIECTTIALEHLGISFDVQGGGSDLVFPHHEMGAAEGHLLAGTEPFARLYAHTGLVGLDGHKMSKSRGNLVFVSTLRRQGVDPAAIRLAILAHHYRHDWEWTTEGLREAQDRLERWRAAAARALAQNPPGEPAAQWQVVEALRERLADDLDAPGALGIVDSWAEALLTGNGARGPLVPTAVSALLGIEVLPEHQPR
ncbi:MAG: L-cysteine:1D-myo-inositol 2-amino-2-deoxy-alpha-D-glucopyranoside ligase [Actinomycetota bacterium]|nr:L-cysteine:1D-myo-inositol 2-amino-2-deoxy-alpha-D-glucopyranoside ligase [Actinomycetota bacterium]